MAMDTMVILNRGGSAEKYVEAGSLQVPDMWHLAMWLQDKGDKVAADQVLACWYLCHDLTRHIQETA